MRKIYDGSMKVEAMEDGRAERIRRLVLLSAVIACLAMGTLAFLRQRDFALRLEIPPCFRIGGERHHYFEADCSGTSPVSGIPYRINEDSLRERPRAEIGTGAVLVLGDSNVEGKGLVFEETLSQLLESGSDIRFINAGLRTRGPVLESLALRELYPVYKPKSLLWVLNENDVSDDRFAFALKQKTDAEGVPISLSTEDFDGVREISAWRARLGGMVGILDFLVYRAYRAQVTSILERQDTGHESCAGIRRGLRFAREQKLPVLFAIIPLGPHNPEKYMEAEFPAMLPCLAGERVLDFRELKGRPEFFLDRDTHLNKAGNQWLAERILPEFSARGSAAQQRM